LTDDLGNTAAAGPRQFRRQRLTPEVAKALGRGDRDSLAGAQHARLFDILPRGWPVAAVTRQRDAGDASQSAWLRADPAYVRPDINGARLLAYGSALALTPEEVDELLRPLRPLFGDSVSRSTPLCPRAGTCVCLAKRGCRSSMAR
jgi:hypothetical protein